MIDAAALQSVIEAMLRDLQPGAPGLPAVTPSSVLDRDLGLDSLARLELLMRTERTFGVQLPEDTLQQAETVADLLQALQRGAAAAPVAPAVAPPARAPRAAPVASPAADSTVPAAPDDATTLLEVLDWHLRAHPDQTQVICLVDEVEHQLSYAALVESAAAIAAGLQRAGVTARQSVALMLPTSPDYFGVYLGILRAGAVPVPIYPPARASQLEDHVLRHAGLLANAQAKLLVTVPEAMGVARLLQARVPGLRQLRTPAQLVSRADAAPAGPGLAPAMVAPRGDDIAFLQYTSGSTGKPKGVVLTHANLLANIRAMALAEQVTPRDVFVSWLPLYHDMGLIGAWLTGLYIGFPLVVMAPLAFLAQPLRWLQAITHYRGTLSAAPNFAYALCLKHISDTDLAGLDLSSWRLACNGAEAVSPDTLQRFGQRFAACGLRPEAIAPVYGLAEACVGLLFPPLGRAPVIDHIQREPFTRQRRAVPAPGDDTGSLSFVACGRPLPGHAVRLLDDAGREVGERVEGRLEFSGPSATAGYFRNPAMTERLIHDGWLDTGDRAYRADGDYFITGRVKDIIIRGGRNLYPQEIEEAVGAVAGVRQGCVAAFGSPDAATGTERLVVMAEVRAPAATLREPLREAVLHAVTAAIGEPPDQVLLVAPHTVLKTSSGKVRRSACRDLAESGQLDAPAASARRQWLRLAWSSAAARLRQTGGALAELAFGLRAWAVFSLLALPVWVLAVVQPSPARAWAVGGEAIRLLLRLCGLSLEVRGLDQLPAGPCVLVVNHASYVDGLLLVAALPRPFAFVAKRELRGSGLLRLPLQRLGTEFVERFDVERSVADATRLADAVASGRSLAYFPEGTFAAQPDLLPFHLGAFLAAAQAGVPVLPVALRGSRTLLPGGCWWPRPARLEIEVCTPVPPRIEGADLFAAAVRLREAARQAMRRVLDRNPPDAG